MPVSVTVIGECMLELSQEGEGVNLPSCASLSYGGDTLNTAVYLSRLGVETHFLTALGADPFSQSMLSSWMQEDVCCDHVVQLSGKLPGLYSINTDCDGERSFHYWRDNSAARYLFQDAELLKAKLEEIGSEYLYLSGITLALFSEFALIVLFDFLRQYRSKGGKVIFDSNFRRVLWKNDCNANTVFSKMREYTDIALPTYDDEIALNPELTKAECLDLYKQAGVSEVVLKCGTEGALLSNQSGEKTIALENIVKAVDTTAAGDSFNAGYISAFVQGHNTIESIKQGQKLAATVVAQSGAIIPLEKMPQLTSRC